MSSTTTRIPDALWLQTKDVAKEYLEEIAAKRDLTNYTKLALEIAKHLAAAYTEQGIALIRAHDDRMETLLGDILWEEVHEKRPPLTCLVTLQVDPNSCGAAFYTRCAEYGLYDPARTTRLEFWSQAVRETHAHWGRIHPPTKPSSSYVGA